MLAPLPVPPQPPPVIFPVAVNLPSPSVPSAPLIPSPRRPPLPLAARFPTFSDVSSDQLVALASSATHDDTAARASRAAFAAFGEHDPARAFNPATPMAYGAAVQSRGLLAVLAE